jgi:thiol:disulfide interchange protein
LICSNLIGAQTKPLPVGKINFIEDSWQLALKKAREENKLIFVDAYAAWCGPCKQLKATTFKDVKAAGFYNKSFVNLTIDTEKGQGEDLAAKWGLESYPTLYIFSPAGKMLAKYEGFMTGPELIAFGQQTLKKLNYKPD